MRGILLDAYAMQRSDSMRHTTLVTYFLTLALCLYVGWCDDANKGAVTFGSTIKLEHDISGYRLHSHSIPYGSGSGQQSVTAHASDGDVNSYWLLKASHDEGKPQSFTGHVIRCGSKIRLQHLSTHRNLHSHLHRAPFTSDYEVSAYADEDSLARDRFPHGDNGDDWKLICIDEQGWGDEDLDVWIRGQKVAFQHVDTGAYLSSSTKYVYPNPILGQLQVACTRRKTRDSYWRTKEGVYLQPVKEGGSQGAAE